MNLFAVFQVLHGLYRQARTSTTSSSRTISILVATLSGSISQSRTVRKAVLADLTSSTWYLHSYLVQISVSLLPRHETTRALQEGRQRVEESRLQRQLRQELNQCRVQSQVLQFTFLRVHLPLRGG